MRASDIVHLHLILLYVFAEYIVLHKSSLEVFSLECEKCGLVNGYDFVDGAADGNDQRDLQGGRFVMICSRGLKIRYFEGFS